MGIQKLGLTVLSVTLITGCAAQPEDNQFNSVTEKTLVFDPVYQQDLINLDNLDLPIPVDKENELMDQTAELSQPQSPSLPAAPVQPVEAPKSPAPEVKKQEPVAGKISPSNKPSPTENAQDLRTSRQGIGSVYYLPVLTEKRNCSDDKKVHMRDTEGKILALLCRDEIWNCVMQGSCFYKGPKGLQLFAYSLKLNVKHPVTGQDIQEPRFKINNELKKCPFGMGFRSICLDPYRSVAADTQFHKAGDVVYLPKLVGQKLPNGETHDGFFVVRDIGGKIKGEGRFDFFIGFDLYEDHLFTKLNLSDVRRSLFTYHRVGAAQANVIRQKRAFPLVPDSNKASTLAILDTRNVSQIVTAMELFEAKFGIR